MSRVTEDVEEALLDITSGVGVRFGRSPSNSALIVLRLASESTVRKVLNALTARGEFRTMCGTTRIWSRTTAEDRARRARRIDLRAARKNLIADLLARGIESRPAVRGTGIVISHHTARTLLRLLTAESERANV